MANKEKVEVPTAVLAENNKQTKEKSEKKFVTQAQKILDSIKNSPYFRKKNHHEALKEAVKQCIEITPKEFAIQVLYKGKVQVRTARVHDALIAVKELVTDATQYAPTSRTEKGENITDNYPADLSTVRVSKTAINIMVAKETDNNESLPLIHLAYCAADLRIPQVVALVTKNKNECFCYVFVCQNRVKARELVNNVNHTFETVWKEWRRKEQQEREKEDSEKVENDLFLQKRREAAGDKSKGKGGNGAKRGGDKYKRM